MSVAKSIKCCSIKASPTATQTVPPSTPPSIGSCYHSTELLFSESPDLVSGQLLYFNNNNKTLCCLDTINDQIEIINTVYKTKIKTIYESGKQLFDAVINENLNKIYVANNGDNPGILVIDGNLFNIVKKIPIGVNDIFKGITGAPKAISISQTTNNVYVIALDSNNIWNIYTIDCSSDSVLNYTSIVGISSNNIVSVTTDDTNNKVYMIFNNQTDQNNILKIFDTTTNNITTLTDILDNSIQAIPTIYNNLLYVLHIFNMGIESYIKIYNLSTSITETIPLVFADSGIKSNFYIDKTNNVAYYATSTGSGIIETNNNNIDTYIIGVNLNTKNIVSTIFSYLFGYFSLNIAINQNNGSLFIPRSLKNSIGKGIVFASSCGPYPSPTPTITPTLSATPTITPTLSATPTITPTLSATPTITPTLFPTPTPSPAFPNCDYLDNSCFSAFLPYNCGCVFSSDFLITGLTSGSSWVACSVDYNGSSPFRKCDNNNNCLFQVVRGAGSLGYSGAPIENWIIGEQVSITASIGVPGNLNTTAYVCGKSNIVTALSGPEGYDVLILRCSSLNVNLPSPTPTPSNFPVGGTRSQIPLEDSGGAGTAGAHWENTYRSASYRGSNGFSYPGVSNELMVGTISPGQSRILSKLSIGALLDFGYIENNPGTSEGNPTIVNSLIISQNISKEEEINLNCECNLPNNKIGTITNLSKHNTIEALSSPILFNKSSWASIVSEPYKTYLDQAADRWSIYMSYNPSIVADIKGLNGWSSWNGLALAPSKYTLYNDQAVSIIASCGPWDYVDLQTNGAGVQFNSLTFQLNINNYYLNIFSSSDWLNIITHELGHALGIGIYWNSSLASMGAVPPVDYFLNGEAYINCKNAYNNILQ